MFFVYFFKLFICSNSMLVSESNAFVYTHDVLSIPVINAGSLYEFVPTPALVFLLDVVPEKL